LYQARIALRRPLPRVLLLVQERSPERDGTFNQSHHRLDIMTPWIFLDSTRVPGDGSELCLYQRGTEFSIKIAGRGELMSSRSHGSEDTLAEQACARLVNSANPRLLIGGLGMGFTLAAALRHLGEQAQVVVAELVPGVVDWNRGVLGALAGHPLLDPRVSVCEKDVARVMMSAAQGFDAILLDVDNGPEGLTRKENDWLYGEDGLNEACTALRPGGVLAVWSAGSDPAFLQRLHKVGFEVEEVRVRAHGAKGARYVIWFARRVV
jgi:spermidine synthase